MNDMDDIDLSHAGPRVEGHARGAWLLEARALLRLALPLAATQLAQMAILATDTFMLGHYSTEALAASALGNTVFFFAWLLGCGPANAVPPVIAHILGENPGDDRGVRAVVRMGLWAAGVIAPLLLCLLLVTGPILTLLGQEPKLAADAGLYMSALCWGLPFALVFHTLRGFCAAVDRPVAPLIVMAMAVLFNAAGDYALIFGHFGLPSLGLVGAGIASACSNLFSVLALLAVIFLTPALKHYRVFANFRMPHWPHLRELFRLGLPIGLTTIFEVMLFNSAALMMGALGTATLAAHQIAITVPSLTFMVPLGIGLAATVRVGLAKGAGDDVAARRAGFVAMTASMAFMSCTSLLLLLFPQTIAEAWLSDAPANAEVIRLTVAFLYVAALFQIADGLQVTASLALRGLKDARAPMWIAGASYWLFGFPTCLLLGFVFDLGGMGIWYGLAASLFVVAASLIWRFNSLSRVR